MADSGAGSFDPHALARARLRRKEQTGESFFVARTDRQTVVIRGRSSRINSRSDENPDWHIGRLGVGIFSKRAVTPKTFHAESLRSTDTRGRGRHNWRAHNFASNA